eukprot:3457623-Rhodomonas_salina.1
MRSATAAPPRPVPDIAEQVSRSIKYVKSWVPYWTRKMGATLQAFSAQRANRGSGVCAQSGIWDPMAHASG